MISNRLRDWSVALLGRLVFLIIAVAAGSATAQDNSIQAPQPNPAPQSNSSEARLEQARDQAAQQLQLQFQLLKYGLVDEEIRKAIEQRKLKTNDLGEVIVDDTVLKLAGLTAEVDIDASGRAYDKATQKWLRTDDTRYQKILKIVERINKALKENKSAKVADPLTSQQAPALSGPAYLERRPTGQSVPSPAQYIQQFSYENSKQTLQQKQFEADAHSAIIQELKTIRAALDAQTELLVDTQKQLASLSKKLGKQRNGKKQSTKSKKRKK